MGASFSQENGNFLDDHFLNKMANFYKSFFNYITFLQNIGVVVDVRTSISHHVFVFLIWTPLLWHSPLCTFKRTNTLSRLFLLFYNKISCQKSQSSYLTCFDRFWRKNLKKRPVLIDKSAIAIFMSTGKVSWNRSHPNFVRNWQSRCFNSVIRN